MVGKQRVLIIKLGALGDVVMATSFIRRIQLSCPDDDISVLTTPSYAELFSHWAGVTVKALPRQGITAFIRMLRWIRSQQFDCVFDLQSNDRTALLLAASGIPRKVGNHPRFPYTHHPETPHPPETYIFDRMNEVLASAGITAAEPSPFLPAGEQDVILVQEWMQSQGLDAKPFVLMHAGGSPRWLSKRWPHFEQLAHELLKAGISTVWIGADADRELNRRLAVSVGIDATNRFSVLQLAELGRHARLAVTSDSGPMHILSASGIPVYSFFGPTDSRRHHALGQQDRVIQRKVECSPCYLEQCPPEKQHKCLQEISAGQVISKMKNDGVI